MCGMAGDLSEPWSQIAEIRMVRQPVFRRSGAARWLASALKVRRELRIDPPDVVYTHLLSLVPFARTVFSRAIPIVLHVRDDPSPVSRRFWRAQYRRCSSVIFVSNSMKDAWREAYGGHRSYTVVPNGVDHRAPGVLADLRARTARRVSGGSTIAFVGRDAKEKGLDVLLDAMQREPLLHCDLVIAGSLSRSRPRIAMPGLAERVHELGYVTSPWPLLREVAVVAMPSRREPFGRVAIEAMARGIPVVATATGGLVEILAPLPECLVAPGDAAALAEVIANTIRSPPSIERLVEVADAYDLANTLSGVEASITATLTPAP